MLAGSTVFGLNAYGADTTDPDNNGIFLGGSPIFVAEAAVADEVAQNLDMDNLPGFSTSTLGFADANPDFWTEDDAPFAFGLGDGYDRTFTQVNNFVGFEVPENESVTVDFIYNENSKLNAFGFTAGSQTDNTLIQYYSKRVIPDPALPEVNPVVSLILTNNGAATQTLSFFSDVDQNSGLLYQNDPTRFKIFQEYLPAAGNALVNNFIFAAGDNNGSFDGDFDDGIFYISAEGSPIVPEPSVIGLIALGGLGGILFFRRRRLANKA